MPATYEFIKRTPLPVSAQQAFDWHMRPGAFQRLAPPWEPVEVLHRDDPIAEGSRMVISLPLLGPLRKQWVAEHRNIIPGEEFSDVQIQGPFAYWEHTHRLEATGPDSCVLEDRIEFRPPLGWLGACALPLIRGKLQRAFRYRHSMTAADLQAHARVQGHISHTTGTRTMKILVTGSTGLVGSALVPYLTSAGHQVVRLVRQAGATSGPYESEVVWNPTAGELDPQALEGLDAVIHLAGEGVATKRWTTTQKQKIRDSRVIGTRLLAETLAKLNSPPQTFLCASAIGYYGNRGDDLMTEDSPAGTDFLSEVCQEWEAAADPARAAGIRTVNTRIGVVLSPKGGALHKMLTPFKLGVGGILGSGQQVVSWVALDDILGALEHVLHHPEITGPVNLVAPTPVRNLEFTKTLGRVLRRPTIFPAPAFALKLMLGQMAEELLLSSTNVQPQILEETGYQFRFPTLEPALRFLLGKE